MSSVELDSLSKLIDLLRKKGVKRYASGGIELELGALPSASPAAEERPPPSPEEKKRREDKRRERVMFAHVRGG
jgi:hypothetical protein